MEISTLGEEAQLLITKVNVVMVIQMQSNFLKKSNFFHKSESLKSLVEVFILLS
jgi:hypothetical protein